MADFKIKSGAGSGNKTLLQGQDQVDSAYAIEIGDAGATTLTNATLTAGSLASGVTGGSGLTALGTVATGNLSNSAIVYPAGHVLRTFYDESDAASHTIAAGDTLYWDELDLNITSPSTSDYLIITLNLNAIYNSATSGSHIQIGFAYSVGSWSTVVQLGTVANYDRPNYLGLANGLVTNSSVTIRVNHPSNSDYHIRPKITAATGASNINQSGNVSTITALEIKG